MEPAVNRFWRKKPSSILKWHRVLSPAKQVHKSNWRAGDKTWAKSQKDKDVIIEVRLEWDSYWKNHYKE